MDHPYILLTSPSLLLPSQSQVVGICGGRDVVTNLSYISSFSLEPVRKSYRGPFRGFCKNIKCLIISRLDGLENLCGDVLCLVFTKQDQTSHTHLSSMLVEIEDLFCSHRIWEICSHLAKQLTPLNTGIFLRAMRPTVQQWAGLTLGLATGQ